MAEVPPFKIEEVPAELVFEIEHTFKASAEQLFRAFTEKDLLVQWFGPEGWCVPAESAEVDPRVGGVWKFTMVNDDDPSMTSPSNAVFATLKPNKLIEGIETMPAADGEEPGYLYMRIEFKEEGDKTHLKIAQGPLPTEYHEPGAQRWTSSFNKLQALVSEI